MTDLGYNHILRTSAMSNEHSSHNHNTASNVCAAIDTSSTVSHSSSVSPLGDYALSYPAGPIDGGYFTSTASNAPHVLTSMDGYPSRYTSGDMGYNSSSHSPDDHAVLFNNMTSSISSPTLVSNHSILPLSTDNLVPQASSHDMYSIHTHSEHQQAHTMQVFYDRDYASSSRRSSASMVPFYHRGFDTSNNASTVPQMNISSPNMSPNKYDFLEKKSSQQTDCRRNSLSDHLCQKGSFEKKHSNGKKQSRHKDKKRCTNCHASSSPSWRRSISKDTKGNLLCNACGLYEKTAKKKRMLLTQPDGNTKVIRKRDFREFKCSSCKSETGARWRKIPNAKEDRVVCEKCARSLGRR